MMHSTAEKQELKEWQDSEKRDRKENAARQNEAMEQLLNVMECQVVTLQLLAAEEEEMLCGTAAQTAPLRIQLPSAASVNVLLCRELTV
ncbi:hypothetical protein UY3_12936 [Chelonia mydas]|uniref:Uncharacterized protein n=1 Tax=Chelonia mydas TaxID=8469 RepID=M7AYX6_CHEMY|nr:hypothetical protein UY3_12936 [Chelonia mydas]